MIRLAFPTRIKASHSPSFLFTFLLSPSHYFSCVSFLLSLPFNFSVLFQYNISLLLFLLLYSTAAHTLLSLAFIYFLFLFLLILCVRVCLDFLPTSLVFFIFFFFSLPVFTTVLTFLCLSVFFFFFLSLSKTVSFSLWESLLRRKHFMCTLPFLGCMTWNMGKRNSKLKPDEIEELRTKTYCKYLLVKKTVLFFLTYTHSLSLSLSNHPGKKTNRIKKKWLAWEDDNNYWIKNVMLLCYNIRC